MNTLEFTLFVGLGGLAAGFLGALTGLGGGVVIVPLLTLAFGVDIHYAIGASLVSVIATSSGAAAAYVREGYSNVRVGMFLEIATTVGALTGGAGGRLHPRRCHCRRLRRRPARLGPAVEPAARRRGGRRPPRPAGRALRWTPPTPRRRARSTTMSRRVPLGFALMYVAGLLSGLLGIGSGALKVLAMDRAMRLPFKVSTTTSNFMIGVTAAASAGVYLGRGYIRPSRRHAGHARRARRLSAGDARPRRRAQSRCCGSSLSPSSSPWPRK